MTKPTKWHERPAKTQISLGISPVWSESSLYTQWVVKDPSFLHLDSKDSDQTGWMLRLICLSWVHMPFCKFCHAQAHFSMKTYVVLLIRSTLPGTSNECPQHMFSWRNYLYGYPFYLGSASLHGSDMVFYYEMFFQYWPWAIFFPKNTTSPLITVPVISFIIRYWYMCIPTLQVLLWGTGWCGVLI